MIASETNFGVHLFRLYVPRQHGNVPTITRQHRHHDHQMAWEHADPVELIMAWPQSPHYFPDLDLHLTERPPLAYCDEIPPVEPGIWWLGGDRLEGLPSPEAWAAAAREAYIRQGDWGKPRPAAWRGEHEWELWVCDRWDEI